MYRSRGRGSGVGAHAALPRGPHGAAPAASHCLAGRLLMIDRHKWERLTRL